jgi:hypothetical protein
VRFYHRDAETQRVSPQRHRDTEVFLIERAAV